ncbi:MAG: preprotein translocase subunit SecG [Xanthomonadaceae bacterium]|nr:preprotein translocase subunit SecG [Xanthomonadaceae bacterium]MCC7248151.1 preprotein translocase subunit SecG [Lysobacter sp.]
MLILNVIYVLIAISMIALILMQRGAGAQAGSGFGAGASATVFGSRGASNFMSKATKWLAILFFGISLYMAWYATHSAKPATPSKEDAGLMSDAGAKPSEKTPAVPAIPSAIPSATPSSVPNAPAPTQVLPVPTAAPTPAQPTNAQPLPAQPVPAQPVPAQSAPAKQAPKQGG